VEEEEPLVSTPLRRAASLCAQRSRGTHPSGLASILQRRPPCARSGHHEARAPFAALAFGARAGLSAPQRSDAMHVTQCGVGQRLRRS
jgi:hypothetical protein